MLLLLLLAVLSHSTAVVVSSGSAETAAGDVCRGCAAVADSTADDRRDGAPMSDATDTMSVQLVLCVADSVWRAAGHLAWVCCMPTAHSHRAC